MKKIMFILTLLLFSSHIYAQNNETNTSSSVNTRKITIEEAVSLAADNNIQINRQKLNLDMLEKRNKYSWNSVSPTVGLSANFNKLFDKDTYDYSISGSVRLSLSPSLYTAIKTAKLNYEAGLTSYEEAVRNVELNVRKVFYNLIYTKESIALQNRNMETAKKRYQNNRDKYNRGQLSELDLLQSQYSYESMLPNIESALIAYENSMANFKQTLGLGQEEQIELAGSLTDAIPQEDLSVDVTVSKLPSVKNLERKIELQKTQLLSTRFSYWGPSVTASYSYGQKGAKGQDGLQATGNSLSLSVSIPLDGYLPWTNGALSIDNQKIQLQDLELQLKNEKTSASINVQNSLKNIKQKQDQINMLAQNVELAQKTYDMVLIAYNHGSKDLMAVQNSADSLASAQLNQQTQIYNLICSVLDLENTLGVPFGTLGNK